MTICSGRSVAPAPLREALAQEEVAIAGHHADRHAGVRDAAHSLRDALGQRLAQLVVADPGVEEVAEEIDACRIAGRTRAERIERFDQRRPRRRQVQIGEEQRRLYRTSSARSITTSSVGTFWWMPLFGRRHALDLVDDVLPRGHAPEHAVAPALRARTLVVEEIVVGDIDEELRGGRVRVGRARHRDGVALVLQTVARLVGDRARARLSASSPAPCRRPGP